MGTATNPASVLVNCQNISAETPFNICLFFSTLSTNNYSKMYLSLGNDGVLTTTVIVSSKTIKSVVSPGEI